MFAMAYPAALRQQARKLRQDGWPLRPIANDLGVALSTISLWVRGVPLPTRAAESTPSTSPAVSEEEVGTRRCGKCQRDLPLKSFGRHPEGRQWWCRECFRDYVRARGELHRDQSRAARRRRRREAREFIIEYLQSRRCTDCGEADRIVLEFDHVSQKTMECRGA